MEELENISFQIIATVGCAKSLYIEAIQQAKIGNYNKAKELINEGDLLFIEGHKIHMNMIQNEANGIKSEYQILFIHAEDQLMSTESFGILAREFIELYTRIKS